MIQLFDGITSVVLLFVALTLLLGGILRTGGAAAAEHHARIERGEALVCSG